MGRGGNWGKKEGFMVGGRCAGCFGDIFIKFQCDNSRKRGPEKGMTCPGSQCKSVAHIVLDLGSLILLSKWPSHVQMEFQAQPLPGQMPLSSSTADQAHQGRDPQGADGSVSHLPLRMGGKWIPFAGSWGRAHFAFVVSGRSQATPNWFLPLNIADFRPSALILSRSWGGDPH